MTTTTPIAPASTLLIGPGGTGKTTSIVTLLAEGIKVRLLATEPTAPNRILEEARKRNISTEHFHWRFVSPSPPKWQSLIDSANAVNVMSLKDIADLKGGFAKQDGKQWVTMLNSFANFESDRDGTVFGDVTTWGPDCALVVDGLTGVSTMSRNLTVGLKPNPAPGEWGVMQSNIQNLLLKLTSDCRCFFVLIGHVERETNELTGMSNITVSTLGAKLAPKLPPLFTNVVYAKRVGTNFLWSTADTGVDTKSGDLPLSDILPPSFEPIIKSFKAREAGLKAAQPAPLQIVKP
jgi:hypothetical protein